MKTKFFFFLAMLLMSSVGAFAQSETNTPLEGDLNHDGKVDAADITYLVNIILKKTNEPVEGDFWYWGDDIDNAGAPGDGPIYDMEEQQFGWHRINEGASIIEVPYWNTEPDRKYMYYVVPVASGFNDIVNGAYESQKFAFTEERRTIGGVEYYIWKSIYQIKRAGGLYIYKR